MDYNIKNIIDNFVLCINEELKKGELTEEEELNDWLQLNWEELVEQKLKDGMFLEIIGEGADIHEQSSRVNNPFVKPTHKVVCKGRCEEVKDVSTNINVNFTEFEFDGFVNWNGQYYEVKYPINSVLLQNNLGDIAIVLLEDIEFDIVSL